MGAKTAAPTSRAAGASGDLAVVHVKGRGCAGKGGSGWLIYVGDPARPIPCGDSCSWPWSLGKACGLCLKLSVSLVVSSGASGSNSTLHALWGSGFVFAPISCSVSQWLGRDHGKPCGRRGGRTCAGLGPRAPPTFISCFSRGTFRPEPSSSSELSPSADGSSAGGLPISALSQSGRGSTGAARMDARRWAPSRRLHPCGITVLALLSLLSCQLPSGKAKVYSRCELAKVLHDFGLNGYRGYGLSDCEHPSTELTPAPPLSPTLRTASNGCWSWINPLSFPVGSINC